MSIPAAVFENDKFPALSAEALNGILSEIVAAINDINTTISGINQDISDLTTLNAEIANIKTSINGINTTISNMNQSITNLQTNVNSINNAISDGVGGYKVQTTAPTNTKMLWINPNDNLVKYYDPNSNSWKLISAIWS